MPRAWSWASAVPGESPVSRRTLQGRTALSASSATLDAYDLATRTRAVLLGQPPADPADEYGTSGHQLRLPGSGIVITYTTKTFDTHHIRMGLPDIYVAPAIGQIVAGQDPVLETALDTGRHQ